LAVEEVALLPQNSFLRTLHVIQVVLVIQLWTIGNEPERLTRVFPQASIEQCWENAKTYLAQVESEFDGLSPHNRAAAGCTITNIPKA
jgi:hypothetical protein